MTTKLKAEAAAVLGDLDVRVPFIEEFTQLLYNRIRTQLRSLPSWEDQEDNQRAWCNDVFYALKDYCES